MAKTDQIINVDMQANPADLNTAVDQFYAKMKQVQLLITSIGDKLNANAASFDKKTNDTLQAIRRTQSQMTLIERMSRQNSLNPAESLRLQSQLATQQIRDIRDRSTLERAADEARRRRIETLERIQQENKKETRQALLRELQLHDHIEKKVEQRIRAMERLEAIQRRQTEMAWKQQQADRKLNDAKTEAWIRSENAARAADEKRDRERNKGFSQIEREAAARVRAEERAGEQIAANRQRRQLELDKAQDRMRKAETLSSSERLAMAKKVADLQIRQLKTREDLQNRVNAAQAVADRKTLEMQQATSAAAKRRLREEITLAEFNASRAQRRLGAMDRQQDMLSPREQINREKALHTERINGIRQQDVLERQLAASRERRARQIAQLESNQNAKIQRELMQRISVENHIEAKIKARIRLLEQEAAQQQRANKAANQRGPISGILSPGYMGAALARTSVYGVAAAGLYGVINAARDGVAFIVEFEDKLANLQAIAASTDLQMDKLSLSILETARNSKYATIELVQATTVLAQAGLTSSEMETGLKAVSNLAIATGTDLSTSSETLTSAIGAFQLQASEMPRIADAMVSALNRSKLSIDQVTAAIQYAGATAYESNITFEELIGTAGAMAQAGIRRGSTIGTGLRQFLVDLQDPSQKLITELGRLDISLDQIDVSSRGLVPVLKTLRDAGFDSAQAYASLETRSAAAYLVAKNNIDTIKDLIEAQYAMNQATDAAEKSMSSLSAQWGRFKNLLGETFARNSEEGLSRLKNLLKAVNDELAKNNEEAQKSPDTYVKMKAALVALWPNVGLLAQNFDSATQGLSDYSDEAERAQTEVNETSETFLSHMQKINAVDDAIERLLEQQGRYRNDSDELQTQTLSLARQFDGLGVSLLQTAGNFDGIIRAMQEYRREAYRAAMATAQLQMMAGRNQQAAAVGQVNQALSAGIVQRMPANVRSAFAALRATDKIGTGDNLHRNMLALQTFFNAVESVPEGKLKSELRDLAMALGTRNSAFLTERSALSAVNDTRVRMSPRGSEGLDSLNQMRSWVNNPNEKRQAFGNMTAIEFGEQTIKVLTDSVNALPKGSAERAFEEELLTSFIALTKSAKANLEQGDEKKKEAGGGASGRRLNRERRREQRGDKKVAEAALKGADLDLKASLDVLDEALDFLDFERTALDVYSSLEGWAEARNKAVDAEIKAAEMSAEQAENYRREVGREIADRRRDVSRAMAQGIVKTYDNILQEAERQFNRAVQPFEAGVQLAEGRIAAFDRTYNEANVPDFVRSEQEFKAQQAGEARDQATLSALYTQMEEQRRAMADMANAVTLVESGSLAAGEGITEAAKILEGALDEDGTITVRAAKQVLELAKATNAFTEEDLNNLRLKLEEGQDAMLGMEARANALAESLATVVPTDFMTGLQLAAREYARLNFLNRSMEQQLTMGLTGAFEETHGAMSDFWEAMINNPLQAGSAFEAFGNGVITMLRRMAAEAVAGQLMGLLMGALGGAAPDARLLGSVNSVIGANPGLFFNGGLVRRYNGGGLVTEGVANRDSVLTALAKDEFVLRKPAVDSIGVGFLNEMNRRGKQAIGDMGTTVVAKPARQEMNLYMIAPEEKPQLGPNDVIAVISKDIMKGGSTKKLIKHVAQGG